MQLQVCVSISVGISGFTDRGGREEGIQVGEGDTGGDREEGIQITGRVGGGGEGSLAIIQYEAHTSSLIPGIKDQGSESGQGVSINGNNPFSCSPQYNSHSACVPISVCQVKTNPKKTN